MKFFNKLFLLGLGLSPLAIPVMADPIGEDDYYTNHSMGCMLLRECTDEVKQVFSLLDVSSEYSNTDDFYPVDNEFNNMLVSLNQVGVNVFLADEKYFPEGIVYQRTTLKKIGLV